MKKQLKSLDILKGIGIFMIIMVHNRHFVMKDMSGFRQLINFGQMGCQLFFMVSGMALCYSWYSDRRHFIKRRYLRLAPGYILIMFVNLILNILLIDILNQSPGFIMNRKPAAIITNIFFMHGLFPDYINNVFPGGWYIGTTFILYLIFPLLVRLFENLHNNSERLLIIIIPVLLLILNYNILMDISDFSNGSLYPHNNSFLYYFFTNQLPCFSLGIMLYFQQKDDFPLKCPLVVSFGLSVIFGIISIYLYINPIRDNIFVFLPFIAGLSFYWLAICFIHMEQTTVKKLKMPAFIICFINFVADCGRKSYSMYLVHAFISWYVLKALTTWLTNRGYEYNDLLLYAIIYIPSVFLIYVLSIYMEKLLKTARGTSK